MHKSKIIVFCGVVALFSSLALGQTIPNQQSGLAVNIIPHFDSLDGEGPLVMTIQLKNGSRKVSTNKLPVVVLEKFGDGIKRPVTTVEESFEAFVRLDPKTSYGKKDYLKPGETASLSVDLRALEWNDPRLSILGNSKLGILSPGQYRFSVQMQVEVRENGKKKTETAFSNKVYLTCK